MKSNRIRKKVGKLNRLITREPRKVLHAMFLVSWWKSLVLSPCMCLLAGGKLSFEWSRKDNLELFYSGPRSNLRLQQ